MFPKNLEKKVYSLCSKDYITELINRGYTPDAAKVYVEKFGVPEKMYETYLKMLK